ncbi:hypothetical protein [Stutzerimonas zhaodongensis]|jgi:hypothetical protein|uniref:hypothetical protein n=1 Tax=Stutzerimonas zhaodongensis TaxID=1176257 RepID=UPI001F4D6EEF|nr:hypothetical protein [Stutzerimonas zhaodongensis]UNG18645.1 hypothetical protein MKP10_23200 [Stutzerimonas zhaodongensis]
MTPDEKSFLLKRSRLMSRAVAEAIRENNRLGLTESQPLTDEQIDEQVAALDFSQWKTIPIA